MVGGVPVDIDKDLTYVDVGGDLFINLKKGRQVLDGYDAMCFVRFRKSDSDFKRQERQKAFLVSLKQEVMKPDNILSLPQILEQAKLVLGRSLSDDEIAGLAGFSKQVPPTNIKLGMVPVLEQRHSTDLLIDQEKLPEVMSEFGFAPTFQARSPQ
jgi:anionic cell wall polymer biosynthesis LytR-Cps2A-Psr (LCP) family protein